MAKIEFILSPALEGKYEVINTKHAVLHSRIGDIDFRTISIDQAEQLIKSGTRYLRPIKTRALKKLE